MAKKRIKRQRKTFWDYFKKESDIKRINWKVFIICLVIMGIVAFIGSIFTDTGSWYESIRPSIAPPNFVFPVVWSLLYYLIAVALYYSWLKLERKKVAMYYGINFLLNILWSYLFFTLKNPIFAFVEIIVLWFSILFLIRFNWEKCRTAGYFLIPYLLWVSFAVILNYLIVN